MRKTRSRGRPGVTTYEGLYSRRAEHVSARRDSFACPSKGEHCMIHKEWSRVGRDRWRTACIHPASGSIQTYQHVRALHRQTTRVRRPTANVRRWAPGRVTPRALAGSGNVRPAGKGIRRRPWRRGPADQQPRLGRAKRGTSLRDQRSFGLCQAASAILRTSSAVMTSASVKFE